MATAKPSGIFRLVSKYDWPRFINYFEDQPLQVIFNRLDNYSLCLVHEHLWGLTCDVFLRRKDFYHECCRAINMIANSRKFNIWEKQPQNLSLPEAPLKRYEVEDWINHPCESLDFS